jgi:acyl-ACP thioesterase
VEDSLPAFLPEPDSGRVYPGRRIVRSTDVTPTGRLRLDALARYLQTVAEDDLADSGLLGPAVWLLRRCSLVIRGLPAMGERVTLRTFCSGTGPRWAERTTTLTGESGDLLQACAVWAAVSPESGRPIPPGPEFEKVYGESAQGRTASVRLSHRRPAGSEPSRPWPLRAVDFDTAGHVNNAIAWAAVEDRLAELDWLPAWAEVEYQREIRPGCEPRLAVDGDAARAMLWLLDGERPLASAVLMAK